ncbi:P-loop NTPase [Dorea formicigenerans]|uniref:nucleotide-binding protein n=1 Tax=Dorea formicigenerans TaxID=39486 RepID=UPI00156EA646|nr:P-loop NTPase [Dorea formicigenerans]NSE46991.1 P-loop NTPase [Dorea formicigenerans]
MKKIAIYGKGGIGKSTVTGNLAVAFAQTGYRVLQIGCDPKADSTMNIVGEQGIEPVMDVLRGGNIHPALEDICKVGFAGVYCVEAGGPIPGMGCAGRGIITTFELLEELEAFEKINPDIVLFDVLGDVVCGGFAAPIRENYADEVIIVTSGEKMSLYAAGNIVKAVKSFETRGYASVKGVILNRRNVEDEEVEVARFLEENELPLLGDIPRDNLIQQCEKKSQTVLEGAKESEVAEMFRYLAKKIVEE